MKIKLCAIFLVVLMLLNLVACDMSSTPSETEGKNQPSESVASSESLESSESTDSSTDNTNNNNNSSLENSGSEGGNTGSGSEGGNTGSGSEGGNTGSGSEGGNTGSGSEGGNTGSGSEGGNTGSGSEGGNTGSGSEGGNTGSGSEGGNTGSGSEGGNTGSGSEGGNTGSGSEGGNTGSGSEGGNTGSGSEGGNTGSGGNDSMSTLAALTELLSGYKLNPYAFIPETMLPSYEANLIENSDVISDYTQTVQVQNLPTTGIGEQWKMVSDNLSQSQVFFNVLNVVDNLTTVSITAFENYIDSNPANTAHYSFEHGIYSVTIDSRTNTLFYVLDFSADIPVIGQQNAQIALSMDLTTRIKTVRIQLGDANALTYTLDNDSYTFAIKYLGVRRAYFSISKDSSGNVTGHINEYIKVSAVEINSAADFYISENYVSVVGNKADDMVAFEGTICELYNAKTGKMIAYEVEETLAGLTYNTLWFNLFDVNGINSIKYQEKTDEVEEGFFVNGSNTLWEAKTVGVLGGLKAGSRRYDIEFRKQYFYTYDAVEEEYVELCMDIPMFFVQEEYYSSLIEDVEDKNDVTVAVTVSTANQNKLMSDYDNLVSVFKENKEKISVDTIVNFIGTEVSFS